MDRWTAASPLRWGLVFGFVWVLIFGSSATIGVVRNGWGPWTVGHVALVVFGGVVLGLVQTRQARRRADALARFDGDATGPTD